MNHFIFSSKTEPQRIWSLDEPLPCCQPWFIKHNIRPVHTRPPLHSPRPPESRMAEQRRRDGRRGRGERHAASRGSPWPGLGSVRYAPASLSRCGPTSPASALPRLPRPPRRRRRHQPGRAFRRCWGRTTRAAARGCRTSSSAGPRPRRQRPSRARRGAGARTTR